MAFDILHPVDLVEDIAIGHGYEDLGHDIPRSPMTAKPRAVMQFTTLSRKFQCKV